MKSMSVDKREVDKVAGKPVLDWELFKFLMGIIALLAFVYFVHLLIHMW